jgi:hypothetical protein
MTQLGYAPVKGIERIVGENNPALATLDDLWAMSA